MKRKNLHRPSRILFMVLLILRTALPAECQERVLRGKVLDAASGSPLTGASVQVQGTDRGVVTDTAGLFSMVINTAGTRISVAFLGYLQLDTTLAARAGIVHMLGLKPRVIEYEEVRISADAQQDYVQSTEMSEIRLRQEEIGSLPAILGESDPVRFLQLTPGVQSSTEGGIGFFVRGGSADQNLVLFDDALIYNPGHLLGFLSVFNPDIISGVSLLKSGVPARYGGRLSSVVRVSTDRGRSDKLKLKGQIGLVSSRLSMNRTFNKDRSSFILSGRRASIDLFIKPLILPLVKNSNPYFKDSYYNFWDLNASINHRIGKKDYLSLSGYYGKDRYSITRSSIRGRSDLDWGNTIASMKWMHVFSTRVRLRSSVACTSYDFGLSGAQGDYIFSLLSDVKDYSLKSELSFQGGGHKFLAGLELTRHMYTPNKIDVHAGNLTAEFRNFSILHAWESGIYAEDEFSLGERFSINAGVRFSQFSHAGPYKEYLYDESNLLRDSVVYPAGKSIAFYHYPEPRLSLKYQLNLVSSLKASYMHMAQYVHLATSATVSLPTDIWLPSTKDILPQIGDQFSLGYFRNLAGGEYDASAEGYYKTSKNQLEFIRGVVNNSLNQTLLENIATGSGRSYGGEIFIRKNHGSLTGWLGYSLSRTERRFEKINDGKIYPAKYDRRHDLSVAGIYRLGELWNLSAVFIYVSGNAFTLPIGRYMIQGNLVNEYGGVNNYRMPPYHRLDLAATRTRITRKGNVSSWNFSVYNVYNRANPFYMYFEATGNLDEYTLKVEPKIVSLFPVIPSVSWRFEF